MNKFSLYLHTIRYLKFQQIRYKIFYLLRFYSRKLSRHAYPLFVSGQSRESLTLRSAIKRHRSYDTGVFAFLNCSLSFDGPVDWNFSDYGKLWAYNLNYFDFLSQGNGMDRGQGLNLIRDFINQLNSSSVGLDPYPTSLRVINWIKFLIRYSIRETRIDASLLAQSKILYDNLEYYLMGNHLLENSFALLYASYYFNNQTLYEKAETLLREQLEEQILPDGGHFELSPMYHQVLLDRLLDCINLVKNNQSFDHEFSEILEEKAAVMLGWLRQITFSNGDIPLVNDAANKIAPTSAELFDYAGRLGIGEKVHPLAESGYRKIKRGRFEILIDIGNVGPDYIPGHAHADTFSFLLYIDDKPFIVDTGVSTYEPSALRSGQRRTQAHNTVTIDGQNSSEVWNGFRVARRARPFDLDVIETPEKVWMRCSHDGYRRLTGKPIHCREWHFGEKELAIKDTITGRFNEAIGRFHFHPEVKVNVSDSMSEGTLQFKNGRALNWHVSKGRAALVSSYYHPEFGVSQKNQCLEVKFIQAETDVVFSLE